MWLLRGLIGLIFLALAAFTVPLWFESPLTVIFTIVFATLGLWIMGWVTKLSPKDVRDQDIQQEIKIRNSKWFDLRNRIMGSIAFLLGVVALYMAYKSHWEIGFKALIGAVVFVLIGLWYIAKGAKAEVPPSSSLKNSSNGAPNGAP